MRIYLDYAAATPVDEKVEQAMEPYLSDIFYNPSSPYLEAQAIKNKLFESRKTIAHYLGAKPTEIIFTAGATEADNLAVRGVMQNHPKGNVVISAIEHEAIKEPANKYDCRVAKVSRTGLVDIEYLKTLIDDETALVSIIYANNEIGTIQSLNKIGVMINEIRHDRKKRGVKTSIYFHTDAVQAANYLDLHVSKLGVDLLTLSAAKIYGPKQVGCLYVRSGVELKPIISGGGQEKDLRSGTENVAGIVGFAVALDGVQKSKKEEIKRLSELRDKLMKQILTSCDNVKVVGTMKKRLPNNLNLQFGDIDGERLIMELDEAGVMVSSGAACEAANDDPSHVLLALGLTQKEAQSSIRISLGKHTTENEIDSAATVIVDVVWRLRQN